NPGLNMRGFRKIDGAVRSRGLELDFHGELAENLQVIASYAYIDSRIFHNSGAAVDINGNGTQLPSDDGHRLFGVPRNGGSAWVAYQPSGGSLRGLKLGVGAIIRSVRQGDNANDYDLPGFVRWNTLAGYSWRAIDARFSVQLNVDNLFNTRYF